MAVMMPGPMLIGISGSTGCVTYRVGRAGGRVGLKSAGPRVRTPGQRTQAERFTDAAKAWGELSEADRAEWNQWADEYGSIADPEASPTANGYQRFVGQAIMRGLAGLPPVSSPSAPGLSGADRVYFDFTPSETTTETSVVMLFQLPPQVGTPTRTLVGLTPPRPQSRGAYYGDERVVEVVDLDGPQPGEGLPPLVIDDGRACPPGFTRWATARLVNSAGYTGPKRVVPVLQVAEGFTRAFKVRNREPLAGQVYLERRADDVLTLDFVVSDTDVHLEWNLGAGGLGTVGQVASALSSTGILQLREEVFSLYGRPVSDIPVVPRVRLSLRYQPFPFPVAAV
jgi:hypothetical protein